MKRTIFLKLVVDWENYDDVCDELLLEDTGILNNLKAGVGVERVNHPQQFKIDFTLPNYANPDFTPTPQYDNLPLASRPALRPFTREELDGIAVWLQSDEGKKKMKEGQEEAERIIKQFEKDMEIDPETLREPFNI